jgi:hypothetical protein
MKVVREFVTGLTREELNRLVAHWMGDEPTRVGYCIVWPRYSQDWECAGPALEQLTILASFRHCHGDDPITPRYVAECAACSMLDYLPGEYEIIRYDDGTLNWRNADMDVLGEGPFTGELRIRLAAWRHWLDIEMAKTVVQRGEVQP